MLHKRSLKIFLSALIVLVVIFSILNQANVIDTLAVLFQHGHEEPVVHVVPEKQETLSVIATGDLMLAHRAIPCIRQYGVDYPFRHTKKYIVQADIAMANLEAPFARNGEPFQKTYTFKSPPEFACGIDNAGFDVLTLANNHIMDYGVSGLQSTLQTLDACHLHYCGAGMNRSLAATPAIVHRGGWKIGFLAYSLTYPEEFWATSNRPGTLYPVLDTMDDEISGLKKYCDLVIVSFHWSAEKRTTPKNYQKMYAHMAVDAGADLIIGHHPHVLQGFELYKNKWIAYSLGNYAFGSLSNAVEESVLFKVSYNHSGWIEAEIIPIDVNNYRVQFSPKLLYGEKKKDVIQEVNTLSQSLNEDSLTFGLSGRILYKQE